MLFPRLLLIFLLLLSSGSFSAELDTTFAKFLRIENRAIREKSILDYGKKEERNNPIKSLSASNYLIRLNKNNPYKKIYGQALLLKGFTFENLALYDTALYYDYLALGTAMVARNMLTMANAYRQIANIYSRRGQYIFSIYFNEKSLQISYKNGFLKELSFALNNLGVDHYSLSEHEVAISYFEKSLTIKKKLGDKKNSLLSYTNIGISSLLIGNYIKSYNAFFNAYRLAHELNDPFSICITSKLIGDFHLFLDDPHSAAEYIFYYFATSKKVSNKLLQTEALHYLGYLYEKLGNFSLSRSYYLKSLKEYATIDEPYKLAGLYLKLASLYFTNNKIDSSISFLNKCLSISKSNDIKHQVVDEYLLLSKILESKNKLKESQIALDSGFRILDKIGHTYLFKDLFLQKSKLCDLQGNYLQANRFFSKHLRMKDSINIIDIRKIIDLSESNLQMERFRQIENLKNKEYREQINLYCNSQAKTIIQNRRINYSILGISIGIVIYTFIMFLRYVKNIRMEKRLLKEFINDAKATIIQERRDIAQDIHDFVGSDLNAFLLMIRIRERMEGTKRGSNISSISESAFNAITKIDQIIWSLTIPKSTLSDAIDKLKEYFKSTTEIHEIDGNFICLEQIPEIIISSELNKDIFLASKESLNNALKYAKATHIELTISFIFPNIYVNIHDNGVGFDLSQIITGNGMRSRERRVKKHDGSFQISSTIGEGTKVELIFKIKGSAIGTPFYFKTA